MQRSKSQQTFRSSILVVTEQCHHTVLKRLDALGFNTTARVKKISASEFQSAETFQMLLDEIAEHSGHVFVDDGHLALKLHVSLLAKRCIIAMTNRHPMHVPMPAINLTTGVNNFN